MAKRRDDDAADPRIRERRETLKVQRRRRHWRVIRVVIIVALIAAVSVLAARSRPLRVQSVTVNGAERITPSDVIGAAGVMGRPLVGLDDKAVAGRIRSLPQVLDAEVRTDYWRRSVRVNIVERQPIAFVGASGGYLVVDHLGMAIETTSTPSPALWRLTGEIAPDGVGQVSERAGWAASAAEEISRWSGVAVRDAGVGPRGVFLELSDHSIVYLGSADDLAEKGRVLRAIQAKGATEHWSAKSYDLSSPSSPAVEKQN